MNKWQWEREDIEMSLLESNYISTAESYQLFKLSLQFQVYVESFGGVTVYGLL